MDYNYSNNTPTPAPSGNPTQAMIFGILGLAFSEAGILGLIFSIIGRKKAKECGMPLTGQAKVGNILATVGLIVSIVSLAVWAIYIMIFVVAFLGAMFS